MEAILIIARLVLAGVFVIAGLAKLADLTGSREAAIGFGVPARFARAVGVCLPLAELAIAGALIATRTARWGAVAALVLLGAFVIAIGVALRRGAAPECHCFGQLHSRPAGIATLARNVSLAVAATLLIAAGPGARLGSIPAVAVIAVAGGLALALIVALGLNLMVELLRQNGRLLERIEALEARVGASGALAQTAEAEVGDAVPRLRITDADGVPVRLGGRSESGLPMLLVFADPGCGPCNALLPEIASWQRERSAQIDVAVIAGGPREEARAKRAEHGIERLLVDTDRHAFTAFGVDGTPSAVLLDPDGRVAAPRARGAAAVRVLADRAASGTVALAAERDLWQLSIGDRLPSLPLVDAAGEQVDLGADGEQPRSLLFFDPECPHCQRLLTELQRRPPDPELTVVVTRRTAPLELHELGVKIAFDPQAQAMTTAGVSATPSLLRIDEHATIAAEPVIGAPAVLAALAPATEMVAR